MLGCKNLFFFKLVNMFLLGLGSSDPIGNVFDGVTNYEASSKLPRKIGVVFIFSGIFSWGMKFW